MYEFQEENDSEGSYEPLIKLNYRLRIKRRHCKFLTIENDMVKLSFIKISLIVLGRTVKGKDWR